MVGAQTKDWNSIVPLAQPGAEEHKRPTDVLFIASDYKPNPGGIAAYLDSLARGLIRQGDNVKVLALVEDNDEKRLAFLNTYEEWVIPFKVAYDARPENWLGDKWVSMLEIIRCAIPWARRFLDRTSFFKASSDFVARLEAILERENPSLVVLGHLHLNFYAFALHLQGMRWPYGIIAHDSEFYRYKNINDRARRGVIIKGAKWIAANSHHTKSLVEAWNVAQDKIMIVHPPLSEGAIRVSYELGSAAKNELYTLVTVCRIVQSKGIDTVLRALKILDKNDVRYRYIVAGEGPERASLEKLSVELAVQGEVHFAGYISEEGKLRLLQSADLYVMPSRVNPSEQHEGFGIAFLEAAACGIPAIGSNSGGIPDAVLNEKTGILVEPDSPEKLAEALMFLYRNPERRQEMGRAGMERARSQFSPLAVAAHFRQEVLRCEIGSAPRNSVSSVTAGSALQL